jgi:hypothetical protein
MSKKSLFKQYEKMFGLFLSFGFRREPVEVGPQPGSSFSLAITFRFFATRHGFCIEWLRPAKIAFADRSSAM